MLKTQGFKVVHCHTTRKGLVQKYLDLWKQFRAHRHECTTVLVMFPGQYLVPLAWLLTRFPRKKLLFDVFISLYDTKVSDRRLVSPKSPHAWFLWMMDFVSCHMADELLIDTKAHGEFLASTFFVSPQRIRVEYLGTRDDLFFPAPSTATPDTFEVCFYGNYIPLQGVRFILEAANVLREHTTIHFTLIGGGQEAPAMRALAEKLSLPNVTFVPTVPYERLPDYIHRADLCLGVFGTSQKTLRVIPHKVYDAVACGKTVLTARSPAIQEQFPESDRMVFCNAGDSADIAHKILAIAGKKPGILPTA